MPPRGKPSITKNEHEYWKFKPKSKRALPARGRQEQESGGENKAAGMDWITSLEDALPPSQMLYLFFTAPQTPQVALHLERIIACHPPGSRRYLDEAAILWAKHVHREDLDDDLDACVVSPLTNAAKLRHWCSKRLRSSWTRTVLPSCSEKHCTQFLRILHYIAKRTTFNRTGDLMVHASLYADLPSETLTRLGLFELPYEIAGKVYGAEANHRVRPLFERDPEDRFCEVDWRTDESPEHLALLGCLMAETPGFTIPFHIVVKHQMTYARNENLPAIYIDDDDFGILWKGKCFVINPSAKHPMVCLLIRYLDFCAMMGETEGMSAQSILRGIKDPERVRPAFLFLGVPGEFLGAPRFSAIPHSQINQPRLGFPSSATISMYSFRLESGNLSMQSFTVSRDWSDTMLSCTKARLARTRSLTIKAVISTFRRHAMLTKKVVVAGAPWAMAVATR